MLINGKSLAECKPITLRPQQWSATEWRLWSVFALFTWLVECRLDVFNSGWVEFGINIRLVSRSQHSSLRWVTSFVSYSTLHCTGHPPSWNTVLYHCISGNLANEKQWLVSLFGQCTLTMETLESHKSAGIVLVVVMVMLWNAGTLNRALIPTRCVSYNSFNTYSDYPGNLSDLWSCNSIILKNASSRCYNNSSNTNPLHRSLSPIQRGTIWRCELQ